MNPTGYVYLTIKTSTFWKHKIDVILPLSIKALPMKLSLQRYIINRISFQESNKVNSTSKNGVIKWQGFKSIGGEVSKEGPLHLSGPSERYVESEIFTIPLYSDIYITFDMLLSDKSSGEKNFNVDVVYSLDEGITWYIVCSKSVSENYLVSKSSETCQLPPISSRYTNTQVRIWQRFHRKESIFVNRIEIFSIRRSWCTSTYQCRQRYTSYM